MVMYYLFLFVWLLFFVNGYRWHRCDRYMTLYLQVNSYPYTQGSRIIFNTSPHASTSQTIIDSVFFERVSYGSISVLRTRRRWRRAATARARHRLDRPGRFDQHSPIPLSVMPGVKHKRWWIIHRDQNVIGKAIATLPVQSGKNSELAESLFRKCWNKKRGKNIYIWRS